MDYEIVDIRTVKRTQLKFNLPENILALLSNLGKNEGIKISLDDETKIATHRTRIKSFRDVNPDLEKKFKFRLHRNKSPNDTEYSLYISKK